MNDAKTRQPCFLILDNLEKVLPGEVEVSTPFTLCYNYLCVSTQQADNTRTRMVAEFFVNELAKLAGTQAYILATATNATDLHTLLRTKHVFGKTLELKAPNSDTRRQVRLPS